MLKLSRTILLSLYRWCWQHATTTIILTAVVFLLTSFGISKLQFLLSIDDLIDPDFQTYASLMQVNSEFKDKNTILLSIESKEPFEKKFLCELQNWILKTAKSRTDLWQIQSTFGIRQATVKKDEFKMKGFLDVDCHTSDPETEKIKQAYLKIQKSPWKSILTTNDNYSLTLNFIVIDPEDKKFGSIDINVVPELQKSFDQDFFQNSGSLEKVQVFWGGITTYQSYLRKAFDQTQALNGLMFILSLFIFRFFLGSWKAGFIFNFTITLCMGITFGIMGYLGIPMDVLTNSIGLMTLLACLEDFVFVVYGMYKLKWSLRKSLRHFMVPSFFTSLTTAIGFASLVTSDLSIIRRFGVISAFAAMLEWFLVYIFLSVLLKKFEWFRSLKFSVPKFRFSFTQKNIIPRWLAMALCIPMIVPFLWTDSLNIQDSPTTFFFDRHVVIKTTEHFKKTRGWVTEVSLVFNDTNSDETNREILRQARQLKFVERIEDSYTNNDYLTEGLENTYKNSIIELIDRTVYSQRLFSSTGTQRAQLFLNSMEMDDIRLLIDQFNGICKDNKCTLVGSIISYNEFSVKILNTLLSSLGLSIFLVILLLFSLRQNLPWTDILSLVVASVWGPLILLTIFIVFRIPLTFVSCICASLLEGLAGDNAIHFIFSHRKGSLNQSIDALSEASLIVTLGMMLLVSVFFLSSIASLAILGIYVLVGLMLAFFGDVWILKGLIRK